MLSSASVPTPSRSPGAGEREQSEQGERAFRAFARRPVRLGVVVRSHRSGWERPATVVDISVAGAGVEIDEPLPPGERLVLAFSTPTLWDPLVVDAIVAWAHPVRATNERDRLGRPRSSARAGLAFDYATPDATLAIFEMLAAIGFE